MKCYNHPDREVGYLPGIGVNFPGYHFDGHLYHPICEECASRAPVLKPSQSIVYPFNDIQPWEQKLEYDPGSWDLTHTKTGEKK